VVTLISQFNLDLIVLTTGFSIVVGLLIYWHLDKATRFDVRDLMVDHTTKILSLNKIGQLFALLVSTWIIIHETRVGRLSEFLFTGYMAVWSGSSLLSKYLDNKRDTQENKYDTREEEHR
jgi:hypothetical protein